MQGGGGQGGGGERGEVGGRRERGGGREEERGERWERGRTWEGRGMRYLYEPKSRHLRLLLGNAVLHRNYTRPPSLCFKYLTYFSLVAAVFVMSHTYRIY